MVIKFVEINYMYAKIADKHQTDPTHHYEHIKSFHPYSPLIHRYYDKRQFQFDSNHSMKSSNTSDRSFLSDDDH